MQVAQKILCPIDFSPGSDAALARAVELARRLPAKLELMHVYQLPTLVQPELSMGIGSLYVDELIARLREALDERCARLGQEGVEASSYVAEGFPADCIARRASESGCALIVMGTHGRSGVRRMLLGSVAEQVVRSSPVPVMTVRLPSHDSELEGKDGTMPFAAEKR
jgi:nucleotide-binding universal stress UspA family protein